jgi:2-keto-3-deoxy-6-phosphogluconate aldolase
MTDPVENLSLSVDEETVNMLDFNTISDISFTPSTMTAADFGCCLGAGVDWVRRFPASGEGFLIQIINSPTKEL